MKFLLVKALKKKKILNTIHYSWGFMVAFTQEKYILKTNAFSINIAITRRIWCAHIADFFHYLFIVILLIIWLKVLIIIFTLFYGLTYIISVTVLSDLSSPNCVRFIKAKLQHYTMAVFLLELTLHLSTHMSTSYNNTNAPYRFLFLFLIFFLVFWPYLTLLPRMNPSGKSLLCMACFLWKQEQCPSGTGSHKELYWASTEHILIHSV